MNDKGSYIKYGYLSSRYDVQKQNCYILFKIFYRPKYPKYFIITKDRTY